MRPLSGSCVTCRSLMTCPTVDVSVSSAEAVRPHLDALADVAGLELQIDALHLVDVQLNVGLDRELEACLLGSDEIVPDRQQRHDVAADIAGRRLTRETGLLAGDDHLDALDHGAAAYR